MKLTFNEITDWKEFEKLVADYFRSVQHLKENNVSTVFVEPSGEGSDGGRDILVTFQVFDSIKRFERKWVIQCKYYSRSISKGDLSSMNIPTLIHEYGADGYLLVCKNGVTAKVTEMFENLRKNCKFRYDYMIWEDNDFLKRVRAVPSLIEHYFPTYFNYLQQLRKQV